MKLFRPMVTAALAVAIALIPVAGSAQTAPTTPSSTTRSSTTTTVPAVGPPGILTVDKSPVKPGDTITFTQYGCPVKPRIVANILQEGIPGGAELEVSGAPVAWTATYMAQQSDLSAYADCDGEQTERVPIDVDFPRISFAPIGNVPIAIAGAPKMVYGTDCPPGTTALARVRVGDVVIPYEGAIDGNGDWSVGPIQPASPGETVEVDASCGDVTYPRVAITVAGGTTSPPPPPTGPSPAPPATPSPARPNFTG